MMRLPVPVPAPLSVRAFVLVIVWPFKSRTAPLATLTALVLGLLISSAKNSYDAMNNGLVQLGAKVISLDRVLAQYGPETKEARDQLGRDDDEQATDGNEQPRAL